MKCTENITVSTDTDVRLLFLPFSLCCSGEQLLPPQGAVQENENDNEKPYTQQISREKLVKEMLDIAPPQPPPVMCMPIFCGPEDIEGEDEEVLPNVP